MSQNKLEEKPQTATTPETKHYAYSRGYRAGLLNKRPTDMPSSIRFNRELREEYTAGWQESQDELKAGSAYSSKDNKIQRFIWFGATLAAGALMAFFTIQKYETNSQPQTNATPNPLQSEITETYNEKTPTTLSLLTPEERSALTQATQDLAPQPPLPLVEDPHLSGMLLDKTNNQPLPERFYFPTRQVIFQLTTSNQEKNYEQNQAQNLYKIRWLWQRNLIKEHQITLSHTTPLKSELTETHSKLTMTKARQGKWEVEVLDQSAQLLYLYHFYFEPTNEQTLD